MKIFRYLVVFCFLSICLVFFVFRNKANISVYINNISIEVKIADSFIERMRGLSLKNHLKENEGLLFIFDEPGNYGFWMKDMKFPIDIAWIDKNKQIIHIESNVATSTYPKVFYPNQDSLYVLEVNANFFVNKNIKIGDNVVF